MRIFDYPHEQVAYCRDAKAGLKAIIAIHSTRLGPALGGARMFPYAGEEEALRDALRLAEAMTYKAAVAGLPMGGGKAVILADPARDKTPQLFKALGRFIEGLSGRYITAEDSGTSQDDMALIATQTRYVTGLPGPKGSRGDPALATALGVFLSMKETLKFARGTDDLSKVHVAIQGVGSVGSDLAKFLHEAKVKLTIADKDMTRAKKIAELYGAQVVDPAQIHKVAADIFSPCGLGPILNDETIPQILAPMIVGSANNQLLDSSRHSAMLAKRGIVYAPDYVVNAGGIIKLFLELKAGTPQAKGVRVENIPDTLRQILAAAKKQGCTTEEAAQKIARQRLEFAI